MANRRCGGIYDFTLNDEGFSSLEVNEGVQSTLPPFEVESRDEDIEDLKETLQRELRLHRYRNFDLFLKGGPTTVWRHVNEREVKQLVFQVNDIFQATEFSSILDLCKKYTHTTVHTRLVMPTGMGKTTRVPWEMCKAMKKNVLLLVPTIGLLHYAKKGLEAYGAHVRVARPSSKPCVIIMTYADFVHRCAYGSHIMFNQLGLGAVCLDECHDNTAYAYSAKAILSTKLPDLSVLLMSATQVGLDLQNQRRTAPPIVVEKGYKYESIFSDKRWTTSWRRDRTCVFMPSDIEIYRLRGHLQEHGYLVDVLDSASTWADTDRIMASYSRDSMTPRFLLALPKYGTGYPLPVKHIIDSGYRSVYQFSRGATLELTERMVPFTNEEVIQHAGRACRDFGTSGSVTVLTDERLSSNEEIVPGDRMHTWLLLKICGIRPATNVFPGCGKIFPNSAKIPTYLASMYFSTSLPVELFHAYLGSDGKVAKAYVDAIQQWAYPRRYLTPSDDEQPVIVNQFIREPVGGYDGSIPSSNVMLAVPYKSVLSNRVVMHCIAARERTYIDTYEENFYMDQPVDSDSDDQVVTHRGVMLRKLKASQPVLPEERQSPILMLPDTGFGRDELASEESLDNCMTVYDKKGTGCYRIRSGDITVTIDMATYTQIISGSSLTASLVGDILRVITSDTLCLFVASELFDKWGNAWLTFGNTLADVGVLGRLAHDQKLRTSQLLSALVTRFNRDVELILRVSATNRVTVNDTDKFIKLFSKLFSRNGGDTIAGESVWVSQSEGFIQRVAKVHSLLCAAVAAHEAAEVYSPSLSAWTQQDVPWIGGSSRTGQHGDTGLSRKNRKRIQFDSVVK